MAVPKGLLVVPCAFRSDGTLRALEIDDSDRLKILVDSITGNVSILADENTYLNPVGGKATVNNTSLAAGNNTLTILTVPASQRYIVDHVSYFYIGTTTNVNMLLIVTASGVDYYVTATFAPTSGRLYDSVPGFVLEAGDVLKILITGATLNDDAYAYVFYRRVK